MFWLLSSMSRISLFCLSCWKNKNILNQWQQNSSRHEVHKYNLTSPYVDSFLSRQEAITHTTTSSLIQTPLYYQQTTPPVFISKRLQDFLGSSQCMLEDFCANTLKKTEFLYGMVQTHPHFPWKPEDPCAMMTLNRSISRPVLRYILWLSNRPFHGFFNHALDWPCS